MFHFSFKYNFTFEIVYLVLQIKYQPQISTSSTLIIISDVIVGKRIVKYMFLLPIVIFSLFNMKASHKAKPYLNDFYAFRCHPQVTRFKFYVIRESFKDLLLKNTDTRST